MFEAEVLEINSQTDFSKLNLSDDTYLLLFFHYNKDNVQQDYEFVERFENKYKYHLNWIDISDLFLMYKGLNKKLQLNNNFSETNIEDLTILNYIKEYIFNQFIRTGKYYKI